MKTLYELSAEYAALETLIAEQPAELDAEFALELDRLFAALADDEANKLESYYRLIRRLEMEASAAKAEADQYAMAAKFRENTVARLKDRLKQHLEFTKRTKAETASGKTFAIQTNGGKEPLKVAEGVDLDALPTEYVRIVKSVDNDRVREAIKAGETFDWATLEPRGNHLRIK